MSRRAEPWLLAALGLVGCAASPPRAFAVERASAERAYASGRYAEAAAHWERAARAAGQPRDRSEADFRAGASYARAGDVARAEQIYRGLAFGAKSERAARALFELAELELRHGDASAGYAHLNQLLVSHPRSGVAPRALEHVLDHVARSEGDERALATLDALEAHVREGELLQHVLFARAGLEKRLGRDRAAYATYLELARRYPYPIGALWDDALFEASLLAEKLGDLNAALHLLERMLREQEPSHLQGSYEKPRYAEARFRIAVLYRDRLHDPRRARRAFHRVYEDHPTSLLRDDALFEEARLARAAGDARDACAVLRTLTTNLPDSRYVPCAPRLCPGITSSARRSCHHYIERALAESGAPPSSAKSAERE